MEGKKGPSGFLGDDVRLDFEIYFFLLQAGGKNQLRFISVCKCRKLQESVIKLYGFIDFRFDCRLLNGNNELEGIGMAPFGHAY